MEDQATPMTEEQKPEGEMPAGEGEMGGAMPTKEGTEEETTEETPAA